MSIHAYSATLAIVLSLAGPSAVFAGQEGFRIYWNDGLQLESPTRALAMTVGGRLQADFAGFSADPATDAILGPFDGGATLRRARIFVSATVREDLYFRIQYDWGATSDLKDLYVQYTGLPVRLRLGHFKEPMGLDGSTSSKYTTFMERGLTNAAIAPRNLGFMASANYAFGKIAWAAAVFREDDTPAGLGSAEELAVTLRLSTAPLYRDGGRQLAHLGIGYRRQSVEEVTRFRQRPEIFLAPDVVDTGSFAAEAQTVLVFESAAVVGPWSMQSEYVAGLVTSERHNNPRFWAWYVYGSYFLTGEHRPYRLDAGLFDRLAPRKPLAGGASGPGAWEVALRYSKIDLDDGEIQGGRLADVTAGINWYPTATARLLVNVVRGERHGHGPFWGVACRVQVAY